jgi:phosphatidylglycerophosphate synthase
VSYTLRDVKAAYAQKRDWERQFPTNYWIFRPLSFPVTVAVLCVTTRPAVVAWAGCALGLAGGASLLGLGRWTAWPGVALLLLFALLDAVDGNIARVTGCVSHGGKWLDGFVGETVEGSVFAWLGAGLYLRGGTGPVLAALGVADPAVLLVLGAAATAARWYGSMVQAGFGTHALRHAAEQGATLPRAADRVGSSRYRGAWWHWLLLNGNTFTVQCLLLAAAAAAGAMDGFLLLFALFYGVRAAGLAAFFSVRAARDLR